MKTPRLIDQVRESMPKKGMAPWYTQISPALAAELEEVVKSFKAGKIKGSKTGLANSIAKALQSRGIPIGLRGVQSWLERH
jgi:hypothetical protein